MSIRNLARAIVAALAACAPALRAELAADVAVDYSAAGPAVDPMVFGGNLHYPWHGTLRRDAEALGRITGHSWRVHWWDSTADGYRWDTHTIEPDGEIASWHKLDVEENGDGRWYAQAPNTLSVRYWGPATDFSHSLAVTKTPSASSAYVSIWDMAGDLPRYVRFDLKIDGSVPFHASGTWYAAYASGASDDFRLRLTDDRRVAAVFYDRNGKPSVVTSPPLSTDAWHSAEVRYGAGGGELWIDLVSAGSVALDLAGQTLTTLHLGSRDSSAAGAEGRIFIDAVRVSGTYVGENVLPPWDDGPGAAARYAGYLTFDGNMATLDDLCRLAEEVGTPLIFQIPLSAENAYGGRPGPPYPWDTIAYWADLAEYLNADADPDYSSRTFDWTHATPSDNWANLRAQRGRLEPYAIALFEIGNEPYYQEWDWDAPSSFVWFARKWADTAHALKAADPDIRCGLPGRAAWGLWDAVIPEILARYPGEELIDWLAVHQYCRILGHDDADQLDWWLGAPVARRWEGRPDELAGQRWLHDPEDAYAAAAEYLSGQSNYPSIFVGLTEYNYPISFPYGQYRALVDAVCKAGFIGAALEQGVGAAQVFTLDTEQRHTFGLIADPDSSVAGRELTPSYWVFRLWAERFGAQLVGAAVDGPSHLFDWSFGGTPVWETYRIPYVSVWASRNEAGDRLHLVAVNRHRSEPVAASVAIAGFQPEGDAEVYTVGGAGFTVWSDNAADPDHVVIEESSAQASEEFERVLEPLSVTAIVMRGSSSPGLPARVNFQPDGAAPPGFMRDRGLAYGARGLYEYGWR